MDSVSLATSGNKHLFCALCGDTAGPLYHIAKQKCFLCLDCKYKSLESKAKLRLLTQQEVTSPYYVYALIDPRDRTIRYIGMSRQPKLRLIEHRHFKQHRQRHDWIAELQQQQLEPIIHIIEEVHDTRRYAYTRETYWIHQYAAQGAPLLNVLPGKRKSRRKQRQ